MRTKVVRLDFLYFFGEEGEERGVQQRYYVLNFLKIFRRRVLCVELSQNYNLLFLEGPKL